MGGGEMISPGALPWKCCVTLSQSLASLGLLFLQWLGLGFCFCFLSAEPWVLLPILPLPRSMEVPGKWMLLFG